jgi:putative endopeptidase
VTVETLRSGLDLSHVEAEVRPQDDLFGHVNGRWLAEYTIPGDRATDGAFRTLYDRAEEQVRELITQAAGGRERSDSGGDNSGRERSDSGGDRGEPGTDAQRIGDLYASFLDEGPSSAAACSPCATSWLASTPRPTRPRWPP